MLFVSHDRYFLNQVADHLLVVEPARFRVIEGNYDTYLHFVKKGLAAASTSNPDPASSNGRAGAKEARTAAASAIQERSPAKRKRRFPYRKVVDLEQEILQRETAIEEINGQLADPAVLRSGEKTRTLKADLLTQQESLAKLYEHWEEAVELNG